MDDTKFNIEYIAHLARIKLTEEEKTLYGVQLGTVLDYIEKLREVNVDGVEPTSHPLPLINVMRIDETKVCLSSEDALRNAPLKSNNLFIVPKIIE